MNLKTYLEELLDGTVRGEYGGASTVRRIESAEEFKLITKNGTKSLRGVITKDGSLYMLTSDSIIHMDILEWLNDRYLVKCPAFFSGGSFDEDMNEYLTVISHHGALYLGESYDFSYYLDFPKSEQKMIDFYANIVSMLGIKFIKEQKSAWGA